MPGRNREAVRQRAIDAARQCSGRPAMPSLDPVLWPSTAMNSRSGRARVGSWPSGCDAPRTVRCWVRGWCGAAQRKPRHQARHPRVGDNAPRRPSPSAGRAARQPRRGRQADRTSRTDRPSNPERGRWLPMPAPTSSPARGGSAATAIGPRGRLSANCQRPSAISRSATTATYQMEGFWRRGASEGGRCLRLERTPTATWRDPNRGRRPDCGSPMPRASSKPGTHPHAGWMYWIVGRQAWVWGRGCSPSPSRSSWCSVRCWRVLRSLPQLPANGRVLIMRRGGNRTAPWPAWCSVQPGCRCALAPARDTPPRAVIRPVRPSPHATRSSPRVARSSRRVARSSRPVARSSPHAVRSSLPVAWSSLRVAQSSQHKDRSSPHIDKRDVQSRPPLWCSAPPGHSSPPAGV
jgi:hypothetical protein